MEVYRKGRQKANQTIQLAQVDIKLINKYFFMWLIYLGPGLGGGVIALIIGFVFSILLFLVGLFIKPIKYILRKLRRKQ